MTIPAEAGSSAETPGPGGPVASRSAVSGDLAGHIAEVANRSDLSDSAFRLYAAAVTTFGTAEFTPTGAATAAGRTERQVRKWIGELVKAELFSSRMRIVGYDDRGRRRRRVVYRATDAEVMATGPGPRKLTTTTTAVDPAPRGRVR